MTSIDRRKFLAAGSVSLGALGIAAAMPAWARGAMGGTLARRGSDVLSGEHLSLTVADAVFETG
ncbi:MAG TPA: copper resistance system multicopper oxidase, partial [Hyphomonas sp.]|nr:copper resistance system multicopper oxidase [Hyphomonas sp.]